MVKALLLPWMGQVEGLGPAQGLPLWSEDLEGCSERAALRAGLTPTTRLEPGEEALVLPGGLACGPKLLQAALAKGREAGQDLRFELGGRLGELLLALRLGAPDEPLVYLRPGQGELGERLAAAQPIELPPEERELPSPLPDGAPFPLSDRLALPVRHWTQLLWANLLGLGPFLWGELLGPPWAALPRLALAALSARSLAPEDLAAQVNRLGRGARVHRAAVVEGCWVGEGAQIGAGAVLRGCVLGAGARVEEQAYCEGLVLGPGAVVQRQAMIKYGVIGARAFFGGVTQLSVLGPRSSLKMGSYGMDQGLSSGVRVMAFGALRPAPMGLCGVCLGPDSTVGSGVHIAPGRAVPAGHTIIADHALMDPRPAEGARSSRVRQGRLEPL